MAPHQRFFRVLVTITVLGAVILSNQVLFPQASFTQSGPKCDDPDRDLYLRKPYLQGVDVLELQLRLKELGFDPGPCDGIYGPRTAAAVSSYQKAFRANRQSPVRGDRPAQSSLLNASEQPAHNLPAASPPGDLEIIIDTERRTLTVMVDNKVFRQFPVAVGKPKTPTPVGDWKIIHKGYNWGGGFGVRWLGLNVPWGIYGIHGTNKPWTIGTATSAGCIRMFNEDVLQVFEWVQLHTPVRIIGPPHWTTKIWRRLLTGGCFGPDVVYVQLSLKKLGLYPSLCDGRYNHLTALAVRYFQASAGLPATGEVDEATYLLLQKQGGIPVPPDPEP